MGRADGFFEGWRIVGLTALFVSSIVFLILALFGFNAQSVHTILRITGRTSFFIFSAAFSASALLRFWPNAFTIWLRRNRRQLGVSFALSHTVHFTALQLMHFRFGEPIDTGTAIGGGLGFALIFAMAITSFDATARMIGPQAWRILHTFGGYYVWLVFFLDFALLSSTRSLLYLPLALIAASVLLLRILARRKPVLTSQ